MGGFALTTRRTNAVRRRQYRQTVLATDGEPHAAGASDDPSRATRTGRPARSRLARSRLARSRLARSRLARRDADARRGDPAPEQPSADPRRGRYRLLRGLARGGLGRVSVARDEELGRDVALKEVLAHYAADEVVRQRFVRETEVTGHLEHPGVVPVHGLGTHEGQPYYAMRLIRGESLKKAVAELHGRDDDGSAEHRLAFRELLGHFVAVCRTIGYAHSKGVIHREVKPDNVMLGKFGETLVVDWGLAKVLGTAEPDASALPRSWKTRTVPARRRVRRWARRRT